MSTSIATAIQTLMGRITDKIPADEAMKFSQAALNLAHVAERQAEAERALVDTERMRKESSRLEKK